MAAFEHIFAVMWYAVSGEVLDLDPRYHVSSEPVGESPVAVVDRYPYEGSYQMRKTLARAIDAAQNDIQIVNPYPTNVRTVRRALKRALKRGVNVQIMVSTKFDTNITPDIVCSTFDVSERRLGNALKRVFMSLHKQDEEK